MTLLEMIIDFILGHKYYICILRMRSTDMSCVSSIIFRTKQETEHFKEGLYGNRTYAYESTQTFRSRKSYKNIES